MDKDVILYYLLRLQGANLTNVDDRYYSIKIGYEDCPITEFTTTEIICKVPDKQPKVEFVDLNWHGAPPVLVGCSVYR